MSEQEQEDRIYKLIHYLTAFTIPYNPPLEGTHLKTLKKVNPIGYDNLMEYLTLTKED